MPVVKIFDNTRRVKNQYKMKVLYVHVQPAKTPLQIKAVKDKEKLIYSLFSGEQTQNDVEIIVRDRNTIQDYLYFMQQDKNNPGNEKRFDLIDIVIMEGDPNLLPWEQKCKNIKILFEMCKATNKATFVSGIGMQLLVYFCAIGERNIHVINGQEKGSLLEDIKRLKGHDELAHMPPDDVFLDYSTGDFYSFSPEKVEWTPSGNVGLHYSIALEKGEDKLAGKSLVEKTQIFRAPQTETHIPKLYTQRVTDLKCYVSRFHQSSYIFEGIPAEFIVEARNKWDPHPVPTTNFNLVKHKYESLAESDRGPMVAMHQNTCCVQFQISQKYPETTKILGNFVKHSAKLVTQQSSHMRLKDALASRRKQMNINHDERVMNKTERKQLLHLRNETCSEITRYDTALESETYRHLTSRGQKSQSKRMTIQGSTKNLFNEPELRQDSARNSALAHFRSNTSFIKRESEADQEAQVKPRSSMSLRLALRSAKPSRVQASLVSSTEQTIPKISKVLKGFEKQTRKNSATVASYFQTNNAVRQKSIKLDLSAKKALELCKNSMARLSESGSHHVRVEEQNLFYSMRPQIHSRNNWTSASNLPREKNLQTRERLIDIMSKQSSAMQSNSNFREKHSDIFTQQSVTKEVAKPPITLKQAIEDSQKKKAQDKETPSSVDRKVDPKTRVSTMMMVIMNDSDRKNQSRTNELRQNQAHFPAQRAEGNNLGESKMPSTFDIQNDQGAMTHTVDKNRLITTDHIDLQSQDTKEICINLDKALLGKGLVDESPLKEMKNADRFNRKYQTVEKPQESNDDLVHSITHQDILTGCNMRTGKEAQWLGFNRFADYAQRERSNSSPKVHRLKIESKPRTLEASTDLSFLSKNKSKKSSRSRSRIEKRQMKPEPPKESLFDRTRRELSELGVLNGVSEVSVTQPSHRISNNSQFTGIIAKTQRKPTIRQQPIKPSFFTRYKHFQKMPQLPFDVPCVRISSKYEGVEEQYLREQNEAKLKRVSSQNFRVVGPGTAAANSQKAFIKNYVQRAPSQPAMIHDFRVPVDKSKFVSQKDFRVV